MYHKIFERHELESTVLVVCPECNKQMNINFNKFFYPKIVYCENCFKNFLLQFESINQVKVMTKKMEQ